jgi:hypothetical protein
MSVSSFVVLSNGSVDVSATEAAFSSALALYISERETQNEQIASAVSAVFDEHLGKTITMPVLQSLACGKLAALPDNYKSLSDRVATYVREQNGNTFRITKGKGGGVARLADLPPVTVA